MKTSESQVELVKALLAAKLQFPKIEKNKSGQAGNRKFKYAPLEVIKDACDPILHGLGLMVTQGPEAHLLVTRLDHVSGEWREIRMPMDETYSSDQAYGISFSYRRRYSYQGILGIMTEEDVDGNGKRATKPSEMEPQKAGIHHPVRAGIGDDLPEDWKIYLRDQADYITSLIDEGKTSEALFELEKDKLDDAQWTWLENQMNSKTRAAIKTARAAARK